MAAVSAAVCAKDEAPQPAPVDHGCRRAGTAPAVATAQFASARRALSLAAAPERRVPGVVIAARECAGGDRLHDIYGGYIII